MIEIPYQAIKEIVRKYAYNTSFYGLMLIIFDSEAVKTLMSNTRLTKAYVEACILEVIFSELRNIYKAELPSVQAFLKGEPHDF